MNSFRRVTIDALHAFSISTSFVTSTVTGTSIVTGAGGSAGWQATGMTVKPTSRKRIGNNLSGSSVESGLGILDLANPVFPSP